MIRNFSFKKKKTYEFRIELQTTLDMGPNLCASSFDIRAKRMKFIIKQTNSSHFIYYVDN